MKISLKHQGTEKNSNAFCTIVEHNLHDDLLDMAIVKLTGRYPETRHCVNQQCAELAYVFEGNGMLVINNQTYHLTAGDAVLIEAGEKYYWEGNMQFFVSCRPAWNKEQHMIVD